MSVKTEMTDALIHFCRMSNHEVTRGGFCLLTQLSNLKQKTVPCAHLSFFLKFVCMSPRLNTKWKYLSLVWMARIYSMASSHFLSWEAEMSDFINESVFSLPIWPAWSNPLIIMADSTVCPPVGQGQDFTWSLIELYESCPMSAASQHFLQLPHLLQCLLRFPAFTSVVSPRPEEEAGSWHVGTETLLRVCTRVRRIEAWMTGLEYSGVFQNVRLESLNGEKKRSNMGEGNRTLLTLTHRRLMSMFSHLFGRHTSHPMTLHWATLRRPLMARVESQLTLDFSPKISIFQ